MIRPVSGAEHTWEFAACARSPCTQLAGLEGLDPRRVPLAGPRPGRGCVGGRACHGDDAQADAIAAGTNAA